MQSKKSDACIERNAQTGGEKSSPALAKSSFSSVLVELTLPSPAPTSPPTAVAALSPAPKGARIQLQILN